MGITRQRFALVMEAGPQVGAVYPLEADVIALGREADNTIVLDNPRISRYHARLRISPTGTVLLEDLGSTNGTFIAGQPLWGVQRLQPEEAFNLAGCIRLRLTALEPLAAMVPATPPELDAGDLPTRSVAVPTPSADETLLPPSALPGPGSPRWVYPLSGCLALLTCLIFALGGYLWFAPVSFWEWLLALLGLPLP